MIDPDNPPLAPDAKLLPGADQIIKRLAEHKTRYAEHHYALQVWEDDGGSVTSGPTPLTAHAFSFHNRRFLQYGGECACFCCLRTFNATEVTKWVDTGRTALCPYCAIDSVVPASMVPIEDPLFLRQMCAYWFGRLPE